MVYLLIFIIFLLVFLESIVSVREAKEDATASLLLTRLPKQNWSDGVCLFLMYFAGSRTVKLTILLKIVQESEGRHSNFSVWMRTSDEIKFVWP